MAQQTIYQRLVVQERKALGHSEVIAVTATLERLSGELRSAAEASLGNVDDRLVELTTTQTEIEVERQRFPEIDGTLIDLEASAQLDAQSFQFIQSQLYQARISERATAPYIDVLDPAVGVIPI